jgi:RNA polymerase sigma-70 factor (ECF subfamily)
MGENLSQYDDGQLANLLRGDQRQQETAFAEIYSRYSQKIYLYCTKILDSDEEAADIYQDVFLKFVTTVRQDSVELANIMGYLLMIARNTCLNHKRQNAIRSRYKDEPTVVEPKDYGKKQLLELIDNELAQMEFNSREVFVLRLYQGLSYSEIGKICDLSENAAKNKFWRTKQKLKDALEPYMIDLDKHL